MPADPEQTARLRDLHEQYAWRVNAAVGEGREDLIRQFCGEYVEDAVRILAEAPAVPGGPRMREERERPRAVRPSPRAWWRRLIGPAATPGRRRDRG
jgi:hypothetical protein